MSAGARPRPLLPSDAHGTLQPPARAAVESSVHVHITNGISTPGTHRPRFSGLSSSSTVLKLFLITRPKRQPLTISTELMLADHTPIQSAASASDQVDRDNLSCRLLSITIGLLRLGQPHPRTVRLSTPQSHDASAGKNRAVPVTSIWQNYIQLQSRVIARAANRVNSSEACFPR
ncbi:hypothetical protein MMC34_008295 [Xylographa carneopallida]|nr:hypothetical protein [Xylographa carneopallida]